MIAGRKDSSSALIYGLHLLAVLARDIKVHT